MLTISRASSISALQTFLGYPSKGAGFLSPVTDTGLWWEAEISDFQSYNLICSVLRSVECCVLVSTGAVQGFHADVSLNYSFCLCSNFSLKSVSKPTCFWYYEAEADFCLCLCTGVKVTQPESHLQWGATITDNVSTCEISLVCILGLSLEPAHTQEAPSIFPVCPAQKILGAPL